MNKRNKTIILVSIITLILLLVVGITYAAYVNTLSGTTQKLVLGDIYMHFKETNTLTLSNAMPSTTYDSSKYFEFTIDGKNTYPDNDIYYEILLSHGDNHATRTERIKDNLLKFTLVEIKNNQETVVVDGKSFDEINNTRIWVNTIPKNTLSEVNTTYRLYMLVSSDTKIGNTEDVDYDMDTWNNQVYASIKVNVNGDFETKELQKTAADLIISKYGTDSTLVAVNTDGTLYTGTGEIREYRYSGPTSNNYVIFNDDGDSEVEANELWRIVGVFKNSSDEWNLKLMRNTLLGGGEVPETYTYNGSLYYVYDSNWDGITWNSNLVGTNYNDWTTAGLQYFLNTNSDSNGLIGYYSTFTSDTKKLIDENYEYYLGNVNSSYNNMSNDTAIMAYNNERDEKNIWEGNFPSWNGAIGLLYPSDYGYSADSSYWSETTLYDYDSAAAATSWIKQTANASVREWFLSPSSTISNIKKDYSYVIYLEDSGDANDFSVHYNDGVGFREDYLIYARPVLNLISEATMEDALGTIDNPYRIIE